MVEYRPVEVGVVESFLRRVSREGTAILAGGPRIRTIIVRNRLAKYRQFIIDKMRKHGVNIKIFVLVFLDFFS